MRSLLSICLFGAVAMETAVAAADDVALTLTRDGKPAATIVIAQQPTRAAQFAAYELRWHLQQITGAEFAIVKDDAPIQGLAILVGDSQPVRALGIKPEQLDKQEYLIRFTPEALVLVGRDKDDRGSVQYDQTPSQQAFDTWPGIWDEQGTMYAVYDFLQRCCNVRWFTPTEFGTDCPRQATLTVTGGERQRSPFMKYRYASYVAAEDYDRYTGLWPAGSAGQQTWEAAAYPDLHRRFDAAGYATAKRGWNMLFRLRHRESFRAAAEYVAAAFAALGFVHRVVLFGSVARPPERETPRQWRYRRTGAQLWHEIKDVDLAVWVSEVSGLKALQKARGRALDDLLADRNMGVAHHQVDVFLFEPGTDRYIGRLCTFGVCPKHKPECRVAGCGASLFLRQHEDFAFDPRALGRGTVVLFDRAMGVAAPDPARDDDVPF